MTISAKALLLKGGWTLDDSEFKKTDVLIDPDGIVIALEDEVDLSRFNLQSTQVEIFNVQNLLIAPPFVDMHCHLRAIGLISETFNSGIRAAVKGGFGHLVAMPNTEPAMDDVKIVDLARQMIGQSTNLGVEVEISSAITLGRRGEVVVDFEALIADNVKYFTDDGSGVIDDTLMLKAIELLENTGCILAQHLQGVTVGELGVMNLGDTSTKLGLPGIDKNAEVTMLKRDIDLIANRSVRYHAMHISVSESVEIIKHAKEAGVNITCEVTPHHLLLDETELLTLDPNFKVNPPLRTKTDVRSLREALSEGIIDVIATDHAPHRSAQKELPIEVAPFGMLGLQSAFSAAFTSLISDRRVETIADCKSELQTIVKAMSLNPRKILGIKGGILKINEKANLIVIDPLKRTIQTENDIESQSINSPYLNRPLYGSIEHVFLNGNQIVTEKKLTK